jgi:hypothetical protein
MSTTPSALTKLLEEAHGAPEQEPHRRCGTAYRILGVATHTFHVGSGGRI